jgi:hypothetical protein
MHHCVVCGVAYEANARFCTYVCLGRYRAAPTEGRYSDEGTLVVNGARYSDGGEDLAEAFEDIMSVVFVQEQAALRLPLTWGA